MIPDDEISFLKFVREDLILLDVDCASRDEALEIVAAACLERGFVKPTFYKALLARENEYPTGLPIGEINVAIPHTYPEHVNEMAVGIAVLKQPVVFHNMGAKDETLQVSVLAFLLLKKLDDNVRMLPSLMDFFVNEDNIKALLCAKTPSDVMALIEGFA